MERIAYLAAVALMFAAALPTTPAQAQNNRSFVSAQSGLDTNPCTRTSPCRTFAHALTQTNAGGEINTLDPGGYGSVTIDRAISIVSGLGEAGVLVPSGGTGIIINAGASDVVNLRGLIIEGAGIGQNGIVFNTGQTLTIEKCVVRNHTNNGIAFQPNASSKLVVSDTFVANNKGGNGIAVAPSGSGTVTAVFTRVEVDNNGDGILVDSTLYLGTELNATAADSVAAGNTGVGFKVNSNGTGLSLMMFRSVAASNGTGITAQGNFATLRIGQSTVTGNTSGWTALLGGAVKSYADNKIDGNESNETAPPSISNK